VPKTKSAPKSPKVGKLPSKQEILDFLQGASVQAGKREIARAFGIKGGDRLALKELLRGMADDGLIAGSRRKLHRPGVLPSVTVLEIVERDSYGDFVARPANWSEEHGVPPRILMVESKQDKAPASGVGDRVLARITPLGPDADYSYQARPIKRLPRDTRSQLGIFRALPGGHGVIDPVDRKQLKEWRVARGATNDAESGELVRFELGGGRFGAANARVTVRLGNTQDQRATSLIAIHAHGIPDTFPEAVLREADIAREPELKRREDLRHLPFVTIDPVDARDRDDAVWAEADPDPKNKGGWVVMVAIADVASYVRPGSALDKQARARGNSVYFPDRVVPMLPERISNYLCSLQAHEPRLCLAVRMVFDKDGRKRSHRFLRGLMRSAAALAYEQAQRAIDGHTDDVTGPLLEPVLRPLWSAYGSLARARADRAPLDLDLPERKIQLDDEGRVRGIITPPRLDAHRLIEEFMIAANVAAAEELEAKRTPLIYRVHDQPSKDKLAALSEFLGTLGLKLPKTGQLKPANFNRILAEASRSSRAVELVGEMVLRSQAQAEYGASNFGHFGLNLRRYAHFTSPIRRYADLVVHRALIRALGLGNDGLTDAEMLLLEKIAEAVSNTERRAMAAERETADRLIAAYLADRIGARFAARVSGLTRTGLFVRLTDTGADGFVPASSIGHEYFYHDEKRQALIGQETGAAFQLGDPVEVRLVEAVPSAGALRFELLSEGRMIGVKPSRGRIQGQWKKPRRHGHGRARGRR
jgi:ribonuclease R